MFLLDTNVISETVKRRPHATAMAWLKRQRSNDLFLSAVTIGEIAFGIHTQRSADPVHAGALEDWLQDLIAQFSGRILPIDSGVALAWAKLTTKAKEQWSNHYIAATAAMHNLTVATRNVKDFAGLGIRLVNPFA